MRRVVRRLIKIMLLGVLLLVGLAMALAFFVDANRFKPLIIDRVYQWTGYELVMDGALSWSFFPTLGVTSGHLGLKNPPGSQNLYLIEADRFRFSVRLLPLLQGRVEAGTLAANNATMKLDDPVSHRSLVISHLKVMADSISLGEAFPLQLTFDVQMQNPAISGQVTLGAQALMQPEIKEYTLHQLAVNATLQSGDQHVKLHLGGSLLADLKEWLIRWQDLSGTVANMPVSGDLRLVRYPQMLTTGIVKMGPFDLKKFLQQTGVSSTELQQADGVGGVVNLSVDAGKTEASGSFNMPVVRAANLSMQHVAVPFHFLSGVLDIENATSDFYDGKALLKTIAKFQTTPWQFAVQLGLNKVQLEPLLQDLDGKAKLSMQGTGTVALLLSTSVNEPAALLSQLNGSARLTVADGSLRGVDVGYLLDTALALAGKKSASSWQGSTPFSSLTGTALIRDGVVSNTDLLMEAARFTLNGKGTVDLPASKINYALEAHLRRTAASQGDDITNLYGLPVPVMISGSLQAPVVRLDSAVLLQALAKQQLKKAADRVITRQLGGKIPGQAGAVLNQLLGQ